MVFFFFSSRRRHTRSLRDWSSDVCSSDLICRANGAWELRSARTAEERALVWRGRKAAFAAMGRVSPSYYVQDRSEERRVGKECRCRWAEYQLKKNEGGGRFGIVREVELAG